MPVYVDKAKIPYRRMLMSHMLADTLPELHAMADRIGLARLHFQVSNGGVPHYDVCQTYRDKAISAGAIVIGRNQVVTIMRAWSPRKDAVNE